MRDCHCAGTPASLYKTRCAPVEDQTQTGRKSDRYRERRTTRSSPALFSDCPLHACALGQHFPDTTKPNRVPESVCVIGNHGRGVLAIKVSVRGVQLNAPTPIPVRGFDAVPLQTAGLRCLFCSDVLLVSLAVAQTPGIPRLQRQTVVLRERHEQRDLKGPVAAKDNNDKDTTH